MKVVKNIVQGDTYSAKVYISGVDYEDIDSVYLTSKDLDLEKELELETVGTDNFYRLELSASETSSFEAGSYSFDITLQYRDEDVQTGIYNGIFNILEKYNEVSQ